MASKSRECVVSSFSATSPPAPPQASSLLRKVFSAATAASSAWILAATAGECVSAEGGEEQREGVDESVAA